MRSCSASLAMMEMTTSRIIPQLSKNGSLETAPAYSPIVQLLEMFQCLPHALTAEAI
jgi:hypothetical protein